MNERQQALFDFAMERVQKDKKDEMEAVLKRQFEIQAEMQTFNDKVSALLTSEGAEEYAKWREERRLAREQRQQEEAAAAAAQ